MSETKEVGWFKRCMLRVIAFWNSEWIGIFGSAFISACEFSACHWISGIGWIFAGIWMWAYKGEKSFYDGLYSLYRKHLDLCQQRDTMLEEALEKLRKYEPEDEFDNETKKSDSSIINFNNMDIDHILKIGHDFQNTDTWHGAHYDTVKLLCDTIEHLRKGKDESVDEKEIET